MGSILFKILVVLLIFSGMAGSGYLWYIKVGLEKEIVSLNGDVDAAKKRTRAAIKKYTQEKAKLSTCMRAKMSAETMKAKLKKDFDAALFERKVLEAQKATLEQKLEKKNLTHKKKIAKWKESYQKLADRQNQLMEKYKKALQANREKEERISVLESEKQELQAILDRTESRLHRSLKHNERLCVIAEELTLKYQEETKGKTEPFTKIKMVELEQLIQEYIQRIDKEKIIE